MKQLNVCQTLVALGLNAMIEAGRLADVNRDDSTMSTITNEFYDDASNVDLSDDVHVFDIENRGFVLVAMSDTDNATGEILPEDGAWGFVVETKDGDPALYWHEQIYSGGAWIDAEE